MLDNDAIYIVYDGDCPFCAEYVRLLRVRKATSAGVHLINARDDHPAVTYVISRGVTLDNDMAMIQGGRVAAGAECLNKLALMSTEWDGFNRLNRALFSSPLLSRAAYPILRCGRRVALRLLGRTRMGH